ncbi:muramoyltetrapeptide carboxypeptidase [Actimicrobium sp. GrIS 1.19]|uniref:muramoyltetrapeptide carboxypeptidase n=1 Tax=Actimicrobium sp. GrIS 1.19 TaxID=3071708 RepID=UPI002DFE5D01|nr:muramoyltetrapeptide carboxypeptidase [Actimicrobium sp. GrIS 1.19]
MRDPQRSIGIGIVAPSSYAPDPEGAERAIALLRASGYRVILHCDPHQRMERFAASDAERLAHLHAASRDPEVDIVMALRGGYGLSRLLPKIDWPLLAGSGKLFVGHSDFTALHMGLLVQGGAISFAGPMLCDDFSRQPPSPFMLAHFHDCLHQPSATITVEQSGNPALQASGVLWGGNLAMLTHLVGSAYFPQVDGGILFLEDINEHPFRIERMLLQLLHAGVLARQSAIVLGDFSGQRLADIDNGYSFESVLALLRTTLSVPIVTGLPFGHIADKVTLAVGAPATLKADGSGWQLSMQGYPALIRG